LNYNLPGLPLYARKGQLRHFVNYAAACHWHPDLEFILVLEGSMDYFVNGQTFHIGQGNGIFVNSNRLHYGFSEEMTDCSFMVVVIHPSLIIEGLPLARSYWEDKFGASTGDCILLTGQTAVHREALLAVHEIYDVMHSDVTPNPLRLLSLAASLCAALGDQLQAKTSQPDNAQSWAYVWRMTGYIHQHYELKISLDDIAAAGAVCRSRCCKLFNQFMGQTPNTYLTRYRIQKSCEMLKETDRTICEIAIACGFQSASYFTSIFRKEMGLVPQDYRKQSL
jgi:AraC-like DNA-binding protein